MTAPLPPECAYCMDHCVMCGAYRRRAKEQGRKLATVRAWLRYWQSQCGTGPTDPHFVLVTDADLGDVLSGAKVQRKVKP